MCCLPRRAPAGWLRQRYPIREICSHCAPLASFTPRKLPRKSRLDSEVAPFPDSDRQGACPFRQVGPGVRSGSVGRPRLGVPGLGGSGFGRSSGRIDAASQPAPPRFLSAHGFAWPGRHPIGRGGGVRFGNWRRKHGSASPHVGRPEPSPAGQVAPDRGVQRPDQRRPLRLRLVG